MVKVGWVDYAKAAPILLPASLLRCWRGFYLPALRGEGADLELPRRAFRICDQFDFAPPNTDYDRACAALASNPQHGVSAIRVGPGFGLVFAAVNGPLTWWEEQRMIVNGRKLPQPDRLHMVPWSEGIPWAARTSAFVLLNACDHGRNPGPWPRLSLYLPRGSYRVQSGRYGWADSDPVLDLVRFTPTRSRRTSRPT